MQETINPPRKKDRSVIDANDKLAIDYLHLQYPWYTPQQIKDVIKTAGPLYMNIDRELRLKHVQHG